MRQKKIFNKSSEKRTRQKLRNEMTPAEKKLWYYLKNKQLGGYKFRRQQGIGQYIVDFYCPRLKLIIEIDGDTHFEEKMMRYDFERQRQIESLGIKFLRFTNLDIYENIESVLEEVIRDMNLKTTPNPSLKRRGR
ncbi:MAG TPA: endonuclease domain-containing protein [Patescibacteria group bacterium]|nr:endonuclease domain-containing protein [Patescibacteria group bacterium]